MLLNTLAISPSFWMRAIPSCPKRSGRARRSSQAIDPPWDTTIPRSQRACLSLSICRMPQWISGLLLCIAERRSAASGFLHHLDGWPPRCFSNQLVKRVEQSRAGCGTFQPIEVIDKFVRGMSDREVSFDCLSPRLRQQRSIALVFDQLPKLVRQILPVRWSEE